MEKRDAIRKALQDSDIIVKCPGSLLFFGEYSAVRDQPALVMAIPLFLELGADLMTNQEISFEVAYPKPQLAYKKLRKFGRKEKFAFYSGLVGDPGLEPRIKHELKQVLGSKGLRVRVISEIPPGCGLGSSGALCASLGVATQILLGNVSPKETRNSLTGRLEGIQDNHVFDKIFQFAWSLEDAIHRPSSGVAPFASLVGSPDGLPLIYCSTTIKSERAYEAVRLSELSGTDQKSLNDFLWRKCGFTVMYSGQSRKVLTHVNVEEALGAIERRVDRAVKRFAEGLGNRKFSDSRARAFRSLSIFSETHKAACNYLLKNLWSTFGLMTLISVSNILTSDRRDIIAMTNAAQDLLSFLGISTDRINEISQMAKTSRLGCKLLGSGKGGDVLLIGEKDEVKKFRERVSKPRLKTLGDKPVIHLLSADIRSSHRAVKGARVLKYEPTREITVRRRRISRKMHMNDKLKIVIVALEWRELDKEGKFNKSDLDKRIQEISDSLVECINKNADLVIFPEYTFPVEAIERIRSLVDENGRITVIAGSHCYKDKDRYFNRCPIITPSEIIYQDKTKQSPYEPVPITESDVVWVNEGTNVGSICVMICGSFSPHLKDLEATKKRGMLHFLIVPSYNRDLKTFDMRAKNLCYDYYTHIVIANVSGVGGSAVYGPIHKRRKIKELHRDQKYLVVEIDIKEFKNAWNCIKSEKYKTPEKCRPNQVRK